MKIAIVGAGIAGLTAAHLLHDDHDVTVFEANDHPGGHSNTIDVQTAGGTWNVDTGFIVFNDRNYPGFERLLRRLGVSSRPSDMSFSVSGVEVDFEYAGRSPNSLFAQRRHLADPAFLRMVRDLLRFNREARGLLALDGDGPSLGHYLEEHGYSTEFVERLIVPQAASVWSADPRQLWAFPARYLVEFFDDHGMLGLRRRPRWSSVTGGSRAYVQALVAPLGDRLRLGAPVHSITRHADHVEVAAAGGEPGRFDGVIVATHSDQALRMLAEPSELERELLGAFPYQSNDTVLHTDRSLLPRRRRAWASWNYHLMQDNPGRTTLTYHMNRLQALQGADVELCVTLNRTAAIDPEKVIRRVTYEHPVYTAAGVRAQARHDEINGVDRTWFCGAYWGHGFHEDGVQSALRVCAHFDKALD